MSRKSGSFGGLLSPSAEAEAITVRSGFFSASGRSILSFLHNLCSVILVRIPGAWLATKYFPDTLYAMGLAAPAGSLLSALLCIAFYIALRRKGRL